MNQAPTYLINFAAGMRALVGLTPRDRRYIGYWLQKQEQNR